MPRMRTLDQAAAHYSAVDPETALTKTALRRWVIDGQIPCVRAGGKYLVDLDTLDTFLTGSMVPQGAGLIAPIPQRLGRGA